MTTSASLFDFRIFYSKFKLFKYQIIWNLRIDFNKIINFKIISIYIDIIIIIIIISNLTRNLCTIEIVYKIDKIFLLQNYNKSV